MGAYRWIHVRASGKKQISLPQFRTRCVLLLRSQYVRFSKINTRTLVWHFESIQLRKGVVNVNQDLGKWEQNLGQTDNAVCWIDLFWYYKKAIYYFKADHGFVY